MKLLTHLFVLMLALGTAATGLASEDQTQSPYFHVHSKNRKVDRLPLQSTSANVNIAGVIADVTVTQVYKNEGRKPLEAVYVFPGSARAAVYAMRMETGGRVIEAAIRKKGEARAEYEQAKSEGKRASLLEQSRPNVFTMNVANIMPGDEIKVVLQYTEMLIPESGIYAFAYPTVVGPRYPGGSDDSAEDQFISTPYQQAGEAPLYDFDLKLQLNAGMPISYVNCATHKTNISYAGLKTANVGLDASETDGGNRDFILEYSLRGGKIESGLLLYEHDDEKFFTMIVQPPKRVTPKIIPPRDYVFVVDVSGSMNGWPLVVSKGLLRNLISNLRPNDVFNVVFFAGSSRWWSPHSLVANEANLEAALDFLANTRGGGGTRLLIPMEQTYQLPRNEQGLSRNIVVVTDGHINVERKAFDLIAANRHKANVYAFGIGSSVNRYLMEGIAHVGMGEPFIVTNQQDATVAAEKFREYIQSPVLTQLSTAFEGLDVYDVEPTSLPDVLAERPVIIQGKYRGEPKGTITLKGWSGNKPYNVSYDVSTVQPSKKNSALRYLWAREKIRQLDDYTAVGVHDNHVENVTNLGLKYNLLTAYTSFLAVEDEPANKKPHKTVTVKQPLPMPQNMSNYAIGADAEVVGASLAPAKTATMLAVTELTSTLPGGQQRSLAIRLKGKFNASAEAKALIEKALPEGAVNLQIVLNKRGKIASVEIAGNLPDAEKAKLAAIMKQWYIPGLRLTAPQIVTFKIGAQS